MKSNKSLNNSSLFLFLFGIIATKNQPVKEAQAPEGGVLSSITQIVEESSANNSYHVCHQHNCYLLPRVFTSRKEKRRCSRRWMRNSKFHHDTDCQGCGQRLFKPRIEIFSLTNTLRYYQGERLSNKSIARLTCRRSCKAILQSLQYFQGRSHVSDHVSYVDEHAFENSKFLPSEHQKAYRERKRLRESCVSVHAQLKQQAYQFTLTQAQSSIPIHRLRPTQR
jgi:hypothetical protein